MASRNFLELVDVAIAGCAREGKKLSVDAKKDSGGHYTITIRLNNRKAVFSTQSDAIAYLTSLGPVEREIVIRDEAEPIPQTTPATEPMAQSEENPNDALVRKLQRQIDGINHYLEYAWQMRVCECARVIASPDSTERAREKAGRRYENLVEFKAEKVALRTKYEAQIAELMQ